MFRLTVPDPPADQVRQITFVPFLADGRCVLVEGPGGPVLPAGEVLAGEDYLIDRARGSAVTWRQARWHITEASPLPGHSRRRLPERAADGVALAAWCAEHDVAVEP